MVELLILFFLLSLMSVNIQKHILRPNGGSALLNLIYIQDHSLILPPTHQMVDALTLHTLPLLFQKRRKPIPTELNLDLLLHPHNRLLLNSILLALILHIHLVGHHHQHYYRHILLLHMFLSHLYYFL